MWGVILALQTSRAVHLGVDNLGVVRHVGRLLSGCRDSKPFELVNDGDLLLLIDRMLHHRGLDIVRVSKVKGHADDGMILHGRVRREDKLGNDAANEAADLGRRRVSPAVIDARRNLSGVCSRWYPVILDLHRFFIAISRTVVNHDGHVGRDHPVLGRDVAATDSLDELSERATRLERVVEQIVGVPMPKIVKGDVDVLQHVPRERVQNRTPEFTVDFPVPPFTEDSLPFVPQERVQNRTLEQTVGSPVPQITEEIVERVQLVYDSPVPQITEEILGHYILSPLLTVPLRGVYASVNGGFWTNFTAFSMRSWHRCSSWTRVWTCPLSLVWLLSCWKLWKFCICWSTSDCPVLWQGLVMLSAHRPALGRGCRCACCCARLGLWRDENCGGSAVAARLGLSSSRTRLLLCQLFVRQVQFLGKVVDTSVVYSDRVMVQTVQFLGKFLPLPVILTGAVSRQGRWYARCVQRQGLWSRQRSSWTRLLLCPLFLRQLLSESSPPTRRAYEDRDAPGWWFWVQGLGIPWTLLGCPCRSPG